MNNGGRFFLPASASWVIPAVRLDDRLTVRAYRPSASGQPIHDLGFRFQPGCDEVRFVEPAGEFVLDGSAWLAPYGVFMFDWDRQGLHPPYDRNTATYWSKQPRPGYMAAIQRSTLVNLTVAFPDCGLDQATLYVMYNPRLGVLYDCAAQFISPDRVSVGRPIDRSINADLYGVVPHLRLEGPTRLAPDQRGEFKVIAVDPVTQEDRTDDLEVYLESSGGYLSHRRLTLLDGVGAFHLRTTGCLAGYRIKVKAGFRFYTGLSELIIDLI